MQPGFRNFQDKVIAQQVVELFDKEFSSVRILLPHPLDVTEEKSLGQESSQRRLINRGRMLVHHGANLDHWFDQLLRCQDITQSQGGVEDLAHRACVDNATRVIKSL